MRYKVLPIRLFGIFILFNIYPNKDKMYETFLYSFQGSILYSGYAGTCALRMWTLITSYHVLPGFKDNDGLLSMVPKTFMNVSFTVFVCVISFSLNFFLVTLAYQRLCLGASSFLGSSSFWGRLHFWGFLHFGVFFISRVVFFFGLAFIFRVILNFGIVFILGENFMN